MTSVSFPSAAIATDPLVPLLGELRQDQQALEAFLEQLFTELEARAAELDARERELSQAAAYTAAIDPAVVAERDALQSEVSLLRTALNSARDEREAVIVEREEARRDTAAARQELAQSQVHNADLLNQCDHLFKVLTSARNELVHVQAELTLSRTRLVCQEEQQNLVAEQQAGLRHDSERLQQEREEVFNLRLELAQLSAVRVALATAQEELAQLRNELIEQCQKNAQAESEEVVRLREELARLETVRRDEAAELETARRRVGELELALEMEKRRTDSQQIDWGSELRELRSLLELRAEAAAVKSPNGNSHAANSHAAPISTSHASPASHAAASTADPVIGSVMAQFELLQLDQAKRRGKS